VPTRRHVRDTTQTRFEQRVNRRVNGTDERTTRSKRRMVRVLYARKHVCRPTHGRVCMTAACVSCDGGRAMQTLIRARARALQWYFTRRGSQSVLAGANSRTGGINFDSATRNDGARFSKSSCKSSVGIAAMREKVASPTVRKVRRQ
jgi:hypothetical protein